MPKFSPSTRKAIRARLPIAWLRARIRPLIAAGKQDEEIARTIAGVIDQLLAFDALLPAPFGAVVEAVDGELAYAVALPIVRGVRRATEKM
jgi:hypothetical protein